MRSRSYLVPVLCGFVLAVGCSKKEAEPAAGGGGPVDTTEYTLTLRTPGAGSKVRGTYKSEYSSKSDLPIALGKSRPSHPRQGVKNTFGKEEFAYWETVEEFPDGYRKPTKARFLIDKWHSEPDDAPKDAPRIADREIVIEWRGNYDFRAADGGEIDVRVSHFLSERYGRRESAFNMRYFFLPKKSVRIGTRWEFPVREFLNAMPLVSLASHHPEKSKGVGKLTRVWDKDGRKYGRIELSTDLAPDVLNTRNPIKNVKFDYTWVIELCIDGSSHDVRITVTIDVAFEMTEKGETGQLVGKETREITEREETVGKATNAAPPWEVTK